MHLDLWGEMPDNNCVLSLQSVNIFDKRDETVDDTLQSRTQSSLFQQQEFPQIQQYQSQENVDDDDDADQESFVSNLYLKQKQHFADQINDDQQEEEQAIEYKGHATGDEQPIDFDFENAFIDIPILPLDDGAAMHESIRDTGKDHQQQQQQQADESKAQSETKSHVSSFKEVQEAWHLDGV
ncbi:hypothetical protein MP228_005649 [Amoeboaphelidium protococcarum]|nr:hypothetical protein MP228_005649 [Amoeboaphelidium protococcarum]